MNSKNSLLLCTPKRSLFTKSETVKKDTGLFFESETCEIVFSTSKTMATSTIDANPGDNSILEDDNDPDLSLETGDDPVSDNFI